jgi:hypothetical protein
VQQQQHIDKQSIGVHLAVLYKLEAIVVCRKKTACQQDCPVVDSPLDQTAFHRSTPQRWTNTMTLLETKRRKDSVKKAFSPRKHAFASKPERVEKVGCARRFLSFAGPDEGIHDRPLISRTTERLMQALTNEMISNSDQGACGFVRIADALSRDGKLRDLHAKSTYEIQQGKTLLQQLRSPFVKLKADLNRRYQVSPIKKRSSATATFC